MNNKSLTLPLLALFAVFLLASGVFVGSILRTIGNSSKLASLQVSPSSQLAHVGSGYEWGDLRGWSWSSNIGWISFNGNDAGAGGGIHHVYAATSTVSPTVAAFRGYAWSSNVGWISFEPGDITGCPLDSTYDTPVSQGGKGANLPTGITEKCTPRVDTSTGHISGWARVLSMKNENPATGWLQLSGTNHESRGGGGVTYDPVSKSITGSAWEPLVLGWVSFDLKLGDPDVAVTLPLDSSCTSSAGSSSVPPGTTVTFQANGINGVPPYNYRWGAISNPFVGVNATSSIYTSSGSGPTVTVRDSNLATDTVSCPNVTVSAPTTISFYIGRDSVSTKTSHSLRRGSKFAVSWINNLPANYTDCGIEIDNNGDTYWSATINSGIISNSSSGGIINLQTDVSPKGTYVFDFMCTDPLIPDTRHAAPATLRIIGASDQEE